MDKLLNEFTVNRPIDETWSVLTDVERIAPCMPGAQLQEIEGDVYRGLVKVKLGAISTSFKGQASFTERDDDAHRAVLRIKSRDAGGQGYANADVVFTLNDGGGTIHTAAQISGKAASMGEGVVQTVLDALIGDFTQKLAAI